MEQKIYVIRKKWQVFEMELVFSKSDKHKVYYSSELDECIILKPNSSYFLEYDDAKVVADKIYDKIMEDGRFATEELVRINIEQKKVEKQKWRLDNEICGCCEEKGKDCFCL